MRIAKNGLEWAVFAAGLLVLLALVGFLGYSAATEGHAPPELRVTLERPQPVQGGFRTRVRVENVGDTAAVGPRIKVDDVDLDLDYVPRRSVREGYVFTEKPPKTAHPASAQAP